MNSLRFVYAGNRSGVLREMQSLGLRVVHILPVVNSWLDRETADTNIPRSLVASKTEKSPTRVNSPLEHCALRPPVGLGEDCSVAWGTTGRIK